MYIPVLQSTRVSSLFYAILCFLTSFAVIQLVERKLVDCLLLSSESHVAVIVLCLFLTVQCLGFWCVIEAFPSHNYLLFEIQ